jgi:GntR family transcriptional regulator/MocR family aminotransferase
MGNKVNVLDHGSGLHILVGVKDKRNQRELIKLAADAGVRVYPTAHYWSKHKHEMQNYVLIGFSSIPREKITPGIERLAAAWFGERL